MFDLDASWQWSDTQRIANHCSDDHCSDSHCSDSHCSNIHGSDIQRSATRKHRLLNFFWRNMCTCVPVYLNMCACTMYNFTYIYTNSVCLYLLYMRVYTYIYVHIPTVVWSHGQLIGATSNLGQTTRQCTYQSTADAASEPSSRYLLIVDVAVYQNPGTLVNPKTLANEC